MVRESYPLAREELVRTLTSRRGVTTADGSASNNTLIDSQLIGKNDFLTGKSILILDGDAQYETSGISSFDTSTGQITVATGFSAQIVAGVSYRVLNTLPESLHITSGNITIWGYDYTSGELRKVAVNESGEISIHATVADIVTAKISGQSVIVTSGQVTAKISGETLIVEMSGSIIQVSGQTVIGKVSGEAVLISGEAVNISGATVIAKISGEAVLISGEAVNISGATVIAKVSGEAVLISGEAVNISGATVIAKVSGETVGLSSPTTNKTMPLRATTAASGGEVLHSGAIKAVVVKSISGNTGDMYVGGATDRPYSGFGFLLSAGESYSQDASNFDQIYVMATVSGEKITSLGVN
jgi:hypothetical protein